MTRDTDIFESIVGGAVLLGVGVLLAPLNAMALAYAWNHLVAGQWPVGEIAWRQALGPSVVFGFLGMRGARSNGGETKSIWEYLIETTVMGLLLPAVLWAWVALLTVWL